MKTKTITLRIKVPDWFPGPAYWHRVNVTWKTLKFKFQPFYCIDCGTKIDFKFPEYEHQGEGKDRLLLSHHGYHLTNDARGGVCGHCLANRIRGLFTRTKPAQGRGTKMSTSKVTYHYKKVCDCCHKEKKTIDVSWDNQCDIRFGTRWWNGFFVCEDCLTEAAEKGMPRSGISAWFGGRSYPINSVGAAIGLDTWYRLLLPIKKQRLKNEDKTTVS